MKGIEANISGLEFDLSYKVNNTTFSVDYSTVIGDDINASMPLPYMPAAKARGKLSYLGQNNLSYTFQVVKGFDQKRLGHSTQLSEEPFSHLNSQYYSQLLLLHASQSVSVCGPLLP